MNTLQLDWRCLQQIGNSQTAAAGYKLENGTIVVWFNKKNAHNFATLDHAKAKFPDIVIIN